MFMQSCEFAGMTKLMDANDAGGRFSSDCTLILTEGDSAKSLVVGGLSVAGRDKFGVFPLRQYFCVDPKPANPSDPYVHSIVKHP